uniref:Uncharacterized protein n=1 Tax=Trichogramma kaykai TaxID=54128 RepID=A0ABD2WRD1_9HYME
MKLYIHLKSLNINRGRLTLKQEGVYTRIFDSNVQEKADRTNSGVCYAQVKLTFTACLTKSRIVYVKRTAPIFL